jgi:hypothetical protein
LHQNCATAHVNITHHPNLWKVFSITDSGVPYILWHAISSQCDSLNWIDQMKGGIFLILGAKEVLRLNDTAHQFFMHVMEMEELLSIRVACIGGHILPLIFNILTSLNQCTEAVLVLVDR